MITFSGCYDEPWLHCVADNIDYDYIKRLHNIWVSVRRIMINGERILGMVFCQENATTERQWFIENKAWSHCGPIQ